MATVTNDGLDELMVWLDRLPRSLVDQATPIVASAARDMAAAAQAAYPSRTGDLRHGIKVQEESGGALGVRYVVTNTSKHALWFENGTQVRHNAHGANRGAMPPGHVFIPAAERARPVMYRELKAMLDAEGFAVTGDAP